MTALREISAPSEGTAHAGWRSQCSITCHFLFNYYTITFPTNVDNIMFVLFSIEFNSQMTPRTKQKNNLCTHTHIQIGIHCSGKPTDFSEHSFDILL